MTRSAYSTTNAERVSSTVYDNNPNWLVVRPLHAGIVWKRLNIHIILLPLDSSVLTWEVLNYLRKSTENSVLFQHLLGSNCGKPDKDFT